MIKLITNMQTTKQIDLPHYAEAWKIGTGLMTPDNIKGSKQAHGLLVSPEEDSIENMLSDNAKFRKYYSLHDSSTIAFFNHQNNKFYADSFTTGMKLLTVHKWIYSLKKLNNSPLKDVIDRDHELYSVVWTWMFKHNIRFLYV